MDVPSPEFRLEPLPEGGIAGPGPDHRSGAAAVKTPAAAEPQKERVKLAPVEEPSGSGSIPEEFLADRAPYEFDRFRTSSVRRGLRLISHADGGEGRLAAYGSQLVEETCQVRGRHLPGPDALLVDRGRCVPVRVEVARLEHARPTRDL